MIRLEHWSTTGNAYTPPESRKVYLQGDVYGDPRRPDGTRVSTSRIVAAEGLYVTTKSGRVYLLGAPDPDFVAYLQREGIPFDSENPIRIRGNKP